MAYEKVVTVYDTEEHANEAVRALKVAGFPERDISVLNNQSLDSDEGDANPVRQSGFGESSLAAAFGNMRPRFMAGLSSRGDMS